MSGDGVLPSGRIFDESLQSGLTMQGSGSLTNGLELIECERLPLRLEV